MAGQGGPFSWSFRTAEQGKRHNGSRGPFSNFHCSPIPVKATCPTGRKEKNVEIGLMDYYKTFVVPYVRARFGDTERGASLVEYALLVALIAVVCILAVTFLGNRAQSKFSSIGQSI